MMAAFWSQEEIEKTATLLKDGKTAKQIGKLLGRSRHSVLGQVFRNAMLKEIGFKHNGNIVEVNARKRITAARKSHAEARPIPIPTGGIPTAGQPLANLGYGQCKYSVTDPGRGEPLLFCGLPSEGSWCRHHRAIVYQPVQRRG